MVYCERDFTFGFARKFEFPFLHVFKFSAHILRKYWHQKWKFCYWHYHSLNHLLPPRSPSTVTMACIPILTNQSSSGTQRPTEMWRNVSFSFNSSSIVSTLHISGGWGPLLYMTWFHGLVSGKCVTVYLSESLLFLWRWANPSSLNQISGLPQLFPYDGLFTHRFLRICTIHLGWDPPRFELRPCYLHWVQFSKSALKFPTSVSFFIFLKVIPRPYFLIEL